MISGDVETILGVVKNLECAPVTDNDRPHLPVPRPRFAIGRRIADTTRASHIQGLVEVYSKVRFPVYVPSTCRGGGKCV